MSLFQADGQLIFDTSDALFQSGALLIQSNGPATFDLTATSTISFTQSANADLVAARTASSALTLAQNAHQSLIVRTANFRFLEQVQVWDTLFQDSGGRFFQSGQFFFWEGNDSQNLIVFTQTASVESSAKPRTASNTLLFTQSALLNQSEAETASNTLVLTQSSSGGLLTRSAYNSFEIGQFGHTAGEILLTASNTLNLTQSAVSHLLTRSAYNSLAVAQNNIRFVLGPDAIDLTASSTIVFTQTNNRFVVLFNATELSAESILTLLQKAIFPFDLDAESILTLTQLGVGQLGKSAQSLIEFEHSAVLLAARNLTVTHTLGLNQAVLWLHYRDGVVITDSGCGVTQRYYPFVGEGPQPIRATPPTLVKQTDVLFFYPAGPICAATTSFLLRTPNFGDRDRNQYNRINRETRGGTLQVFRDPQWPKQRTLMMDFTGIKDDEVDGILAFLEGTLGVKVGFRDWEGRVWNGIIMTPDAPVIRNNRNRSDIALELEVDDTELQVTGCSSLPFTQGADAVVVS